MNSIEAFEDEAQAYAEIEALGFHAMTLDIPEESNDFHWHDFDAMVYVTDGELTLTVQGHEAPYTCRRGTRISAAAGVVHREETKGYSAIIGFSVEPQELTQPINKQPVAAG